jgi:AbiV family abortive infection protein
MLRGAVRLSDADDHVNGLALAMLAREEIGRHRILIDLVRRSKAGEVVTDAAIARATSDHLAKQQAGVLSVVIDFSHDGAYSKLLKQRAAAVGTPEYSALAKEVDRVVDRRRKRLSAERHSHRVSAQYVDLNDTADGWNRPNDIPQRNAVSSITHAVNDYVAARESVSLDFYPLYQELAAELEAWPERPQLPQAVWPASRD